MSTVNAFRPSQVVLGTPPLTACFDKTEAECAAAILVWALAKEGDVFGRISTLRLGQLVGDALVGDEPGKPERVREWARNPFLSPDFGRLLRDGFIERTEEPGGLVLFAFTAAGIERLARWVRVPAAGEVS